MLAAAYVTALLRSWLDNDPTKIKPGGNIKITLQPPDRVAIVQDTQQQLNLFLYQVTPNTRLQWPEGQKHEAMIRDRANLEPAFDLHYLLTIYGAEDLQTERLLGYATQRMQRARRLRYVDGWWWADVRGDKQSDGIEAPAGMTNLSTAERYGTLQIVVEPQFLSSEELSKLWSALQARYRLSVAYKVSSMFVDEPAR